MDTTLTDFLTQVFQAISTMGGLSTLAKISLGITLLISTMKVTILNKYVWSRLGPFQTWLAPVLGLVAGMLGIMTGGQPLTLALVFAYFTAGTGAVFLHEILDGIKTIPAVGPIWQTLIALIETALGGPAAQASTPIKSVPPPPPPAKAA